MDLNFAEMTANLGRYLLSIQITDYLDIIILAFVLYKLLMLAQSTKLASLLKGLFIFFAALLLSSIFKLNGIYFIMSHMVNLGFLALIVLFQPEIRRVLEELGSKKLNVFCLFSHSQNVGLVGQTVAQTVMACT